jgi:hypothetical protein
MRYWFNSKEQSQWDNIDCPDYIKPLRNLVRDIDDWSFMHIVNDNDKNSIEAYIYTRQYEQYYSDAKIDEIITDIIDNAKTDMWGNELKKSAYR